MLTLLIGIIIVAGGCYLGFVFYQRKTIKMATEVYDNKRKLDDIPLDDEFRLAQQMNLTGESQKKYDELYNRYQKYNNLLLSEIDQQIKLVKEDGKGINFIKTRNDWKKANELIEQANGEIKEIQAELAQLHDLNKQHHLAIDELKKKNEEYRRVLLEDNEKFGPSIDGLEKMLEDVESTYDEFISLTDKGDPNGAEEVLSDLNNSTNQLSDDIDKIPGLYNTLNVEFTEQLDEITEGYHEMKSQRYNFKGDNILDKIQALRAKQTNNIEELRKLNVGLVQKNNNDIASDIDDLYERLERELKAKNIVTRENKVLGEYLDHVTTQNDDLDTKLKRLSVSYDLNHQEIEINRQYGQQIHTIQMEFDRQQAAITEGSAIYSDIAEQQEKMVRDLSQIEESQKKLYQSIITIPARESDARNSLRDFDLEMRNKKRRVDNLNLPGLPDEYTGIFSNVIKEIKQLDDSLNLPKVNVDDISKQVVMIESDVDSVEEATKQLVDDARLAEQALQFSNRYVASNDVIAEASRKAQELFDRNYNYHESLLVISQALESEKPGSFDKLANEYYDRTDD
ncbi:septation ring formation regulator EzrA [Lentilactobacillus sp. SPB1-3]|uniref:Septation ring formation regulator EzrA n=1 Tax=Lentilactobacillus terminaliae TaxID=3003483 RepID=A0ACD5DD20_9LACO|nr:septation ring formation regulator EzrA [Lentilactobacillus sp. SPB1-3]MCZ0977397.1 septation ring formation regulator EzrA [Lentilactobacillus sp. SPB1-3]